jgi:hypothetical protein
VLAEGVHRSSPAIMTQPNIPLIPRPANGCLETCSSGVTRMLLAFRLQLFVSDIIGKTRRLSINISLRGSITGLMVYVQL